MAFAVTLGRDFKSYQEQILYSTASEKFGDGSSAAEDPVIKQLIAEIGVDTDGPSRIFYTRRKCRDNSLFGNDAINCQYGYCDNDDIVYDLLRTDYGIGGMGRVYSQNIDDYQQIMYVSFGLPEYNSLSSFYDKVVDANLSAMMNKGSAYTFADIGRIAGNIVGTLVMLPVWPLVFGNYVFKKLTSTQITKYYDFRPETAMAYRFMNQNIIHFATNLGLKRDKRKTNSPTSSAGAVGLANAAAGDNAIPDIFKQAGWDIWRMLQKRALYQSGKNYITMTDENMDTDAILFKSMNISDPVNVDVKEKTLFNNFFDSAYETALEGNKYIGIRVEKNVDTSETFSSTTGESPVQQMLNAKVSEARNIYNSAMGGNIGNGVVSGAVESFFSGLTGFFSGVTQQFSVGGAAHLLMGAGYVDVPEIWTGASFSRSYSIKIRLRAASGDILSIFQDLYIPLSIIMPMFLPRAVGTNSYTSPFLIRAYCKGMFSVPLGMFTDVTISRGGQQHGWNMNKLPTAMDIDMTLKDLSPYLYMGMGGTGILDQIFGETSNYQEYLLTLSGVGLYERFVLKEKWQRKIDYLTADLFNNRLNPSRWGMEFAASGPGRLISEIIPSTGLPTN